MTWENSEAMMRRAAGLRSITRFSVSSTITMSSMLWMMAICARGVTSGRPEPNRPAAMIVLLRTPMSGARSPWWFVAIPSTARTPPASRISVWVR